MQRRSRALRPLLLGLVPAALLSAATAGAAVSDARDRGLPNFDAFRSEVAGLKIAAPAALESEGRIAATIFDAQLGKPTFLWARPGAAPIAVGALKSTQETLVAQARSHLRSEAALLGLTEDMIAGAEVFDAQYNGKGPAVVRFRQKINGIEVFGRTLNVMIDRSGRPVAVSGHFATGLDAASLAGPGFLRSSAQALVAGVRNLGLGLDADGSPIEALTDKLEALSGPFEWFKAPQISGGQHFWERAPRIKRIYYPRGGGLQPAYYLELSTFDRDTRRISGYGLVVSGLDTTVLHRRNLVSDAVPFTYTVFADGADNNFHPWDSPLGNGYAPFPGSAPTDRIARVGSVSTAPKVSLVAAFGMQDPWLEDDADETVGNNVEACIDTYGVPLDLLALLLGVPIDQIIQPLNSCVGLYGDITPGTTSANTFDYALAPDEDPSRDNAKHAAAVNLFFINNWLHDAWYVHGFNEAAGNAQHDNYGRGGRGRDRLKAQGQDVSGRNNANMYTPADGSSPTMQQYLFDGPVNGYVRQVSPNEAEYVFSVGDYTPASFEIAATKAVLADDGDDNPTNGCDASEVAAPAQASLSGAVAIVYRGGCPFSEKVNFAQNSGAAAIIIVNNVEGAPISMALASGNTIPSVMIKKVDGDAIKALLEAGTEVQIAMKREPSADLDGTLDNQIIAHEFFHYVHHRLTDSSSQQTGGMSEGWGDLSALVLSVRPEDRLLPGNEKWQAPYGLAGYVVNDFYYGIRRVPYSTDFARNAYTFKHIADGTVTPDGGAGDSNSEVHNAGEIWANMMWECYAALLNHYPFEDAQQRFKDIVISGLKQTPADATYTEARDAILAAAAGREDGGDVDHILCGNGFAKRGAGKAAVSPARSSSDLTGVVEDYTPYGTVGGGTTTAALSATPTAGSAPLQVQFDASGSTSGDGSELSYVYVLGDGTSPIVSSSPSLSYTYTAAGTFHAKVFVSDASGNMVASDEVPITVTTSIIVGPDPDCSDHAVAVLSVTPTQGTAPLTVNFDGSRSFGVCGTAIAGYTWDFGDGSAVQTTATPIVSHVYTQAGTYTPSLSVTDAEGNVSPVKAMAQVKTGITGSSAPVNGNGGGALGAGLLVPLAMLAMLRRRRAR